MQDPRGATPSRDTCPGGSAATRDSRLVAAAVAAAQRGDREGLHFLYVRFAADVQRYVQGFLQDPHEAEDITQNVFAKLLTAIGRYQPREVPFEAWLLRVARNAALDCLRARRATPCEEVRVHDEEVGRLRRERSNDLLAALDLLPSEQREVLVLRHIVGYSPSEIATALNKTESSIHGLHHRGRLCLQKALRDAGATPLVAQS